MRLRAISIRTLVPLAIIAACTGSGEGEIGPGANSHAGSSASGVGNAPNLTDAGSGPGGDHSDGTAGRGSSGNAGDAAGEHGVSPNGGGAGGSGGETGAGDGGLEQSGGGAGAPGGGTAGAAGVATAGTAGTGGRGGTGGTSMAGSGGSSGGPPTCAEDEQVCHGVCVERDSPEHCGTDCVPCSTPSNGIATCEGGACGIECNDGFNDCSGECRGNDEPGACGPSCTLCPSPAGGQSTCTDGVCDFTCRLGYHRCGDTCEATDSLTACGGSCTVCPEPPANATAHCTLGVCGFSCDAGRAYLDDACIYVPQGCTIASMNGKHFAFCSTPRSWTDASAECEAMPGWHLATIASAEEDDFIWSQVTGEVWVGLNDRALEGAFKWDTGDPVTYLNWCDSEPNNQFGDEDCVLAARDAWYCGECQCWNDDPCRLLRGYVCEYTAP